MSITPSDTPLYAALNSKPITDEARTFVRNLRMGIECHEAQTASRKNRRRDHKLDEFEWALGAFLADLLRAAAQDKADGWVFRSMKAESFTGETVSHRAFSQIVKALTEIEKLDRAPGYQVWMRAGFDAADNSHVVTEAKAGRYRATERLLGIAKGRGITLETVHQHFIQALPRHPIVLKSASKQERGNKVSGRRMKIERTPEVERLEADVKRLNEFLDGFTLAGGTHRGYFRVFNLGDQPGFAWNKGGRLYSQGEDSYQRLKEDQRVLMTIDGEPVVEIDIKASYLTILHGRLGKPFDPSRDPYEVDGLEPLVIEGKDLRRWVVKSWVVATLGHSSHHSRWPDKIIADFEKLTNGAFGSLGKAYPIRGVREAMEAKHPILKQWGSLGVSWADLMFAESDAVIRTMVELMDHHGAPSFSVHDSLIVRERDLEEAKGCLTRHYEVVCGLKPALEMNVSDVIDS